MTVAGGALSRAILSSVDTAYADVDHRADAIDDIDEAFKALNKNTTIKFKWWHGRETDDDNDDGDGDGNISGSGERWRRGMRRRREEGGMESVAKNVLAPPYSPETTIKR